MSLLRCDEHDYEPDEPEVVITLTDGGCTGPVTQFSLLVCEVPEVREALETVYHNCRTLSAPRAVCGTEVDGATGGQPTAAQNETVEDIARWRAVGQDVDERLPEEHGGGSL